RVPVPPELLPAHRQAREARLHLVGRRGRLRRRDRAREGHGRRHRLLEPVAEREGGLRPPRPLGDLPVRRDAGAGGRLLQLASGDPALGCAFVVLLAVAAVGAIGVVIGATIDRRHRLGTRRYETLGEMRADLERLTGLEGHPIAPPAWLEGRSVDRVALAGELPRGRRAWLEFVTQPQGKAQIPYARFAVATDPALTVE